MNRLWVLIPILSVAVPACKTDDGGDNGTIGSDACPDRIRDTLGFEYGYDCDSAELEVIAESPPAPMCSSPDVAVFRLRPTRGMLRICYFQAEPGATSGTTSADQCRPIACTDRDECPGGFPCVGGVCRVEPLELGEDSAFALCLADIPWPEMCSFDALHPDFAERIEPLLNACPDDGPSCMLPPECPQ